MATPRGADRGLQRRIVVDPGPRPVVRIERGMYVGQNGIAEIPAKADVNGVAILRYRFQHVAARPWRSERRRARRCDGTSQRTRRGAGSRLAPDVARSFGEHARSS